MSANNLKNEIQFEFIINAIKEIRSNNKRPNNQTIFDHITKTQQIIWIIAKLIN